MDFDITCACHRGDKDNATITGTITFSDAVLESNGISFETPQEIQRFEEALSLCVMDLVGVMGRFHRQYPETVTTLPDAINMFYRQLGTPEGIKEAREAMEEIEQGIGREVDHDELVQVAKVMLGSGSPMQDQTESGIIIVQSN